jgi:hypothetical protein
MKCQACEHLKAEIVRLRLRLKELELERVNWNRKGGRRC